MSHVLLFLDNRASVDEFGDWMLLYTGDIVWNGVADGQTKQLALAFQSHMTNFDTGQIDEKALRQELAKAIQPFSSRTI